MLTSDAGSKFAVGNPICLLPRPAPSTTVPRRNTGSVGGEGVGGDLFEALGARRERVPREGEKIDPRQRTTWHKEGVMVARNGRGWALPIAGVACGKMYVHFNSFLLPVCIAHFTTPLPLGRRTNPARPVGARL